MVQRGNIYLLKFQNFGSVGHPEAIVFHTAPNRKSDPLEEGHRFAEPFPIPKGTTIECVAHFDNSADNPANPDPTKEVRWGDQTWEEMMIGWYSHVDAEKSK